MSDETHNSPPPVRGRSDRKAVREGGLLTAKHRPVSPIRRAQAKSLRGEMTEAEKALWYSLRGHRFSGIGFCRQTPIGPYIADFVSHQLRLMIEVDGGQHSENKKDLRRDRWLKSKGYRVLRLWNSEVLKNRDGVLQTIADAIEGSRPPSRQSRRKSAIGDLPLKGGGETNDNTSRQGGGS